MERFFTLTQACVVCKSLLIERQWETWHQVGPLIIGPGNRTAKETHTEFYCERCGILYHHLPKE